MKGLVAYGDDENDSGNEESWEGGPESSGERRGHGGNAARMGQASSSSSQNQASGSVLGVRGSSGSEKMTRKNVVVIRRPPTNHRLQTRAHISDALVNGERQQRSVGTSQEDHSNGASGSSRSSPMDISPSPEVTTEEQELIRLREASRPKDIPGLDDWGIPPPSTEPVDEEVAAKLAKFLELKRDPTNPKHFNDSLMSNRSFRNPHLYANLVDWANVDEKVTNFPQDIWNPHDLDPEWYADRITEAQKRRAEKERGSAGKRSHIDFTSGQGNATNTQHATKASRAGGKPTRWG
ncbi:HCNGP-like protein-domain-containing protein [Ephemerocybe angulata]|uniref:HCNGP-like protein-domain-containing protein n=1 Tax=Ephemerocybe angulata TaxID=980116 RepID=A0A8H6HJD0_9AGAR|nr:HCNGP-like protein-domain-containing protein [Tulosesus angulatus]